MVSSELDSMRNMMEKSAVKNVTGFLKCQIDESVIDVDRKSGLCKKTQMRNIPL